MKIKSILSALLLMVCTMASAQKYLNVKLEDGTYRSFKATPNMEISFDKTAKQVGESFNTILVNGYQVTIQTAEDTTPHDILTEAYVDGNNVIIKATTFQGKTLKCNVGDNAQCERTITNDKCTFTISEINSDIEAVLGYAPLVTLTVTSDSNGKVWIGDDKNKTNGQFQSGSQVVIHADPNDNCRFFRWNDNNRESSRTITVGETDVTYSASFITQDLIPGIFTVDSNEKQVFFSKGNLYYNGTTFNFEANQYDTTPSSLGNRDDNHISHFIWCDDATNAIKLMYDYSWDGTNKSFFAAKNFTVNGYSGWSVLTGGSGGEWEYLLNKRNTTYGENRRYAAVKVNGMVGLLIFPDEFSSWPCDAGTEPQTFNTYSSSWNDRDYTVEQFNTLQNNGCVFLPAAGFRISSDGQKFVNSVGKKGSYLSASPHPQDATRAYYLSFDGGNVDLLGRDLRSWAMSVRLVTEVK